MTSGLKTGAAGFPPNQEWINSLVASIETNGFHFRRFQDWRFQKYSPVAIALFRSLLRPFFWIKRMENTKTIATGDPGSRVALEAPARSLRGAGGSPSASGSVRNRQKPTSAAQSAPAGFFKRGCLASDRMGKNRV